MYHESIFFLFDKYQSNFSTNSNCEKSFLPQNRERAVWNSPMYTLEYVQRDELVSKSSRRGGD